MEPFANFFAIGNATVRHLLDLYLHCGSCRLGVDSLSIFCKGHFIVPPLATYVIIHLAGAITNSSSRISA